MVCPTTFVGNAAICEGRRQSPWAADSMISGTVRGTKPSEETVTAVRPGGNPPNPWRLLLAGF
jgi:hypothetical protein